ncbi:MAG: hypothetical protein ACM3XZ_01020 [Betaproteobacteria bacterium]
MADQPIIAIGANCVFQAQGAFFLLVEIEIHAPDVAIEPEIVIPLTFSQARALLAAGVPQCEVTTTIPTPGPGVSQELKGSFDIGDQNFIVFDQEDSFDRSVLVVTSVIPQVRGF